MDMIGKQIVKKSLKSLTFSEVMAMAQGSNMKIQWDKSSGNPYFRYKTGEKEHTAWFLDSVTLYNQVKIAMENNAKACIMETRSRRPYNMESFKNPIEVQKI